MCLFLNGLSHARKMANAFSEILRLSLFAPSFTMNKVVIYVECWILISKRILYIMLICQKQL